MRVASFGVAITMPDDPSTSGLKLGGLIEFLGGTTIGVAVNSCSGDVTGVGVGAKLGVGVNVGVSADVSFSLTFSVLSNMTTASARVADNLG